MDDRPFFDQSIKPTEPTLRAVLGSTYTYYKEIIGLASAYSQDWSYSKSGGWMLKSHGRKKALFYLIPLNDGFKISLAIREHERTVFLHDGELGLLQDKISGAEKNTEGYALQFEITDPGEVQPVVLFIRKLIAIRG